MRKWIFLTALTIVLLLVDFLFGDFLRLHPSFSILIVFFFVLSFVLFRLDRWVPEQYKVQLSLVKIVLRLLASLAFILVMIYTQEDRYMLAIQFIVLYLIFMVFEIVVSLTNLRRN